MTSLKQSDLATSKKSLVQHSLSKLDNYIKNKNGNLCFSISYLIEEFNKKDNKTVVADMIYYWKYIENDRNLLNTLFDCGMYDLVSTLIFRKKHIYYKFTEAQFEDVIRRAECDLILHFLKLTDLRYILDKKEIQHKIVYDYMRYGNKMYYGTEMLIKIYKTKWDSDYTKYKLFYIL